MKKDLNTGRFSIVDIYDRKCKFNEMNRKKDFENFIILEIYDILYSGTVKRIMNR